MTTAAIMHPLKIFFNIICILCLHYCKCGKPKRQHDWKKMKIENVRMMVESIQNDENEIQTIKNEIQIVKNTFQFRIDDDPLSCHEIKIEKTKFVCALTNLFIHLENRMATKNQQLKKIDGALDNLVMNPYGNRVE